jgi:hypothetical protein
MADEDIFANSLAAPADALDTSKNEFGLRWQDCEEFLRRLGYRAKVIVSSE